MTVWLCEALNCCPPVSCGCSHEIQLVSTSNAKMDEEMGLCIAFVLYKKYDVDECQLPNRYGGCSTLTDLGMSIIMEFRMVIGDFEVDIESFYSFRTF